MPTSVRVRMYRPGYGDCLLLTVTEGDAEARHILIDCGVHHKDTLGHKRLPLVVKSIQATCGGHIDLVVVTHDHVDHQSGFLQSKADFAQLAMDRLWLAWTENAADPLAKRILADRAAKVRALVALGASTEFALSAATREAIGFLAPLAATDGQSDALSALRKMVGEPAITFCEPSAAPLSIPEMPGLRFYVLGPPRDEAVFLKSRPMEAGSDMYALSAIPGDDAAFLAAAMGHLGVSEEPTSGWDEVTELSYPFNRDERLHVPPKASASPSTGTESPDAAYFREHYCRAEDAWRRIDHDWESPAGRLALAVQRNINNTSLVLALELVESGRVLLFVGDAQIENWQSWQQCRWNVDRNGRTVEVRAKDLLARTVLYKVGHHGSRNATAKGDGLELMASRELVAFIPVDPSFAAQEGWSHPWPSLVTALQEKTINRVAQSNPGQASVFSDGASSGFVSTQDVNALYLDYVVSDER